MEVLLIVGVLLVSTVALLTWAGRTDEGISLIAHRAALEQFAQNLQPQILSTGSVAQFTPAQLVATGTVPSALRSGNAANAVAGPSGSLATLQLTALYGSPSVNTLLISFTVPRMTVGAQIAACQAYVEMGQRAFDIVRVGVRTLKDPSLGPIGADRIADAANTQCTGAPVTVQLGLVAG